MSACPNCTGVGYFPGLGSCLACSGTGWTQGAKAPATKPAAPKVGSLYDGRCKRCRGEALRVAKVLLDKIELFCKLCGKEQEVNR